MESWTRYNIVGLFMMHRKFCVDLRSTQWSWSLYLRVRGATY